MLSGEWFLSYIDSIRSGKLGITGRKQFIGAGAGGCTFFWKTCGGNHGKGTFYEVYYKGKRKEQYFEQDLKIEHTKINKETGERIVVPSREDSFERLLEAEKQFAEDGNSVEDEVIHTIMVEKLQQTLKMLSEEENTIIQALFYENLSETELAKRLGIARTTLQSRKYKILEKLKEYFHY